MSSITTSLNALLASGFSDYSALNASAAARPPFGDAVANAVKPGTRVRAQIDYTTNANGELVQTGATITIGDKNQQRQRSNTQGFLLPNEREGSFADLAKPKANLTPAEELSVFAQNALAEADDEGAPPNRPVILRAGAQDEDGATYDVELLTPDTDDAAKPAASLAAQRQQQAAGLYARNSFAVYASNPLLQMAA